MKQRTKRVVTAWIMTLLMVLSVVVIPGGVAKADSNDANVEFYDAVLDVSDTDNKTLVVTIDGKQIKVQLGKKNNNGQFEPITFGGKNVNDRYEVSCQNVTDYYLYIDNSSNANYSMKVANYDESVDNSGYFQFKNAGSAGVISVQFFGQNNGGGNDNPNQNNPGKLSFLCQGFILTGGDIYYKLGDATDFTKVSPTQDNSNYEDVDLSNATSITLRFVANNGFKLDDTRGITLRVNGGSEYAQNGSNITSFTSKDGYTFTDLTFNGKVNTANASYQLEFGWENGNGGGPAPDTKTNISIRKGTVTTEIVNDGELVENVGEAYFLTEVGTGEYDEEGNEITKIAFSPKYNRAYEGIGLQQGQHGYVLIIDGFEDADAELIINGNGVSIESAGTNSFKSIVLGERTNLEVRPGSSLPSDNENNNQEPYDWDAHQNEPTTTVKLNVGVYSEGGTADRFALRDDVKLIIGKDGKVEDAFKDINTVELYNYDFHKHGNYDNNEIYATNAFANVGVVECYYSYTKITAINLFSGSVTTYDGPNEIVLKGTFEVFQEAQLTYNKDIAIQEGAKIIDRYYDHYPDNSKPFEGETKNAGIIAFDEEDEKGLFVQTIDLTTIAKADMTSESVTDNDHFYTIKKNQDDSIRTITSTDPIIYSVMYKVDQNLDEKTLQYKDEQGNDKEIKLTNGNCGQVEMKDFTKGYYVKDGSHGKFEAWIAADQEVTVVLMPDAGYQYVGNTLNINGTVITGIAPSNEVGHYTFSMIRSAGHISAGFIKTEDVIKVNDDLDLGAKLNAEEGAIKNGNAKLEVEKYKGDEEEQQKVFNEIGDCIDSQFVDISLSEYVVQNYVEGAADQQAWETKQSELDAPVNITLEMLDGADNNANVTYDVARVHYKDGEQEPEITVLDTTYDKDDNSVSFATDKFSTYVIVKRSLGQFDDEVNKVAVLISETLLPIDATKITADDEAKVKTARAAFDKLTPEQQTKVDKDCVDKLLELEKAIAAKKAEADKPAPVTPAPVTPTPSEVGTTVTDKTNSNSSYVVSEKATGTDGVGEATYTGENAGSTAAKVTIPDTFTGSDGVTYAVTKVEDGALKNNTSVTEVTVGDNVEEIGTGAFQNASNLTTVKLGKKVKKVGKNAFNGCKKLKTFKTNGTELTTVEEAAFKNDTSLASVDFSKSKIKKFGKNAFYGCKKLSKLKFNGNYVTKAEKGAFGGIKKNAVFTICAKNKTKYNKVKKLFKKAGASKAKFKFKKQK